MRPKLKSGGPAAVFELRTRLKFTQKQMAAELGIALVGFKRAEQGQRPLSRTQLVKLGLLATQTGHNDLARVFRNLLYGERNPYGNPTEFVPENERTRTAVVKQLALIASANQTARDLLGHLSTLNDPETIKVFVDLIVKTLTSQGGDIEALEKLLEGKL